MIVGTIYWNRAVKGSVPDIAHIDGNNGSLSTHLFIKRILPGECFTRIFYLENEVKEKAERKAKDSEYKSPVKGKSKNTIV